MRYSNSSDQYCFSSKTMYVPCSNHPTQIILIYTVIAGGNSKLACYSLSLCFLLVVLILLGYELSLLMRLKWSLFTIYWKFQMYIHTYIRTLYICWRRQWHPTPVLLPGKSHGWRSLVGCSPWGREESDTTEQLPFHFWLSCIGEGNGNPLQCSCLENPRDGGAWWAAVYGVTQSRTRLKWLSIYIYTHTYIHKHTHTQHKHIYPEIEKNKLFPFPVLGFFIFCRLDIHCFYCNSCL